MNYILINLYKSTGASIATIISQIAVCIAQLYIIRKDMSIRELIKISYKYVIAGIIMLAACLGIKLLLGISLKVMVLQIIVGIIIYIVLIVITRLIDYNDKYIINEILK